MNTRCLLVIVCAVLMSATGLRAAEPKPNVVVLLADDLGFADLSMQGSKEVMTPNIDRLAREGVRCTHGYVSAPSCSPTRVGIMTGRYSQRVGWEFNPVRPINGGVGFGLPVGEKTMGDRMRAAGYVTGAFGKWHLGEEEQFHPLRRGFDEFYGFLWGGHDYFVGDDPVKGPIWRNDEHTVLHEYLTDAIADEAAAFIDRHHKEAFFAYVAFNAPHAPLQVPPEVEKRFASITDPKRRTYLAMVESMDVAIGRVLATLDKYKLNERTLIFFLADNGGAITKFAPNSASNAPLRGQKGETWEGGFRVPFVVRWTGKLAPGSYEQAVSSLDILPTALAAAGAPADAAWKLDGVDVLPYLLGEKRGVPHEFLYWRYSNQMAVRHGDWKLVRGSMGPKEFDEVSGPMLFNVREDIGETKDVAAAHPQVVRELQAAWDKWSAELAPLRWGETVEGKAVKVK